MGLEITGGREEGAVPSDGGHILAVTGTLMGVTFVVVSLRLYARQVILKSFSVDDAVIIVALILAIMVYSAITFSITCVPLRANWIPRLRAAPTTKCQSRPVLSIIGTVNGVINALTDVIFCLLPIPVLLSLRINRRTRTTLFLILSLGLFIFIKLLKGASTAVHPSGDTSRYGYGYGPTDRPKTCHCGEPQYSWSVQDRGPKYLPREILQIPLDSVVVSSGHGDIGGDNGGDRNNDPRSHYEAQVCSSSGGVRHYACEREQREE
ncbi:hypothetical protein PG996_005021 [Apiospora saccharicola]|uniref:Rhodopsin domain-containing protein n=1 Tax=Apiospora saccharicola TaxID=335842 RepID=A0ABR1VPA6_9PEZI